MTYIAKPRIDMPGEKLNEIGLRQRDYEGVLSTLCAGCGHDSITAAIVQAFWELSISPEKVVKLSGIGCSSKTPAYFISGAHGFNSVHDLTAMVRDQIRCMGEPLAAVAAVDEDTARRALALIRVDVEESEPVLEEKQREHWVACYRTS